MNSKQPKIYRFAILIGSTLSAIKIMAKSLERKRPMARPLSPPLKEPHRKTLKDVEWDLWVHEITKKADAAQAGTLPKQKLIEAPKNG